MTKTLLNQELDLDFVVGDRGRGAGAGDLHADAVLPRGLRGVHVAAAMIDAAALRRIAPLAARAPAATLRAALEPSRPAAKPGSVDEAGARGDPRVRRARSLPAAGAVGVRRRGPRPARRCALRAKRSPRRAASPTRSSPCRGSAATRSRSAATSALGDRYLRRVASGDAIAAFAITEPEAGSDAARASPPRRRAMAATTSSTAPRCSSRTPRSRRSSSSSPGPRQGPKRAISAFVVDADTPGLTIARRQEMSAPHPIGNCSSRGAACRPRTGSARKGDGMRLALGTLDFFRTSVGAAACGLAARALDESVARATSRKQFGVGARRLPAHPGGARRHGHRTRRRAPARLPRRLDEGPGAERVTPRVRDGQALRHRGRAAHRRPRRPDPRRPRRRARHASSSGSTARSARCGSTKARPRSSAGDRAASCVQLRSPTAASHVASASVTPVSVIDRRIAPAAHRPRSRALADAAAARRACSARCRSGRLQLAERTWVPAMVPWRATDGRLRHRRRARLVRALRRRAARRDRRRGDRHPRHPERAAAAHRRRPLHPGLARLVDAVRARERRAHEAVHPDHRLPRRSAAGPTRETFLGRYLQITDRASRGAAGVERGRSTTRCARRCWRCRTSELRGSPRRRASSRRCASGYRERVTDLDLPHIRDLPQALPAIFAAAARRAAARRLRRRRAALRARLHDGVVPLGAEHARRRLRRPARAPRPAAARGVRARCAPRSPTASSSAAASSATSASTAATRVDDAVFFGVEFARAGMDFLSLSRGGKFEDAKQPKVGWAAYPYTGPSG